MVYVWLLAWVQVECVYDNFGCQGSIKVMFEVKVKVGSRVRRISCIFDYAFHWIN